MITKVYLSLRLRYTKNYGVEVLSTNKTFDNLPLDPTISIGFPHNDKLFYHCMLEDWYFFCILTQTDDTITILYPVGCMIRFYISLFVKYFYKAGPPRQHT